MKYRHSMPFGAEPIEGGGVSFRLWAPGVGAVALKLDEAVELPMMSPKTGWFELTLPSAGANQGA